jgi:hypothetical protein
LGQLKQFQRVGGPLLERLPTLHFRFQVGKVLHCCLGLGRVVPKVGGRGSLFQIRYLSCFIGQVKAAPVFF